MSHVTSETYLYEKVISCLSEIQIELSTLNFLFDKSASPSFHLEGVNRAVSISEYSMRDKKF